MPTKILTLLFLLCILVFSGLINAQNSKLMRRIVLSNLRACTSDPKKDSGDCEDSAAFLGNLYEKGDRSLLTPLLNAGLESDGALSEALGTFYSDVLFSQTKGFLIALSRRPKKEQKTLAFLAVSADGSGNPENWNVKIKSRLREIADARGKVSLTARLCLGQLKLFLAQRR